MKSVIIIGHGSRDKEAQEQFFEVVDMVKEELGEKVYGAFMELAEPGFCEIVEKVIEEGSREITVFPLFLFPGIHIKEDIPGMIENLRKKYSDVIIDFKSPIGAGKQLVDIVVNRIKG
jgi:sirohydrochlorin cobaltochelatase